MISAVALLVIATSCWALAYKTTAGGIATVSGLMLLYLLLQLLLRPTVLLLGLDGPFPDHAFLYAEVSAEISTVLVLTILWLLAFTVGARAMPTGHQPLLAAIAGGDSRTLVHRLALVMTVLALIGTLPLWLRYGGPTGLTEAVKVERVAVNQLLRAPASLGALFAMAGALIAVPRSRRRHIDIGLYVCCAVLAFSWGARDAAVYPLLLLLIIRPRPIQQAGQRVANRLSLRTAVIAGLCVVAVAVPLRIARDVALFDGVTSTIEDQSVIRQLSVTSNLTMFDAVMLADRQREVISQRVDSRRFLMPFASPPPGTESVSVTIARTYEPARRAGWPSTPIGEWYTTLAVGGVVVGGMLSGFLAAISTTWLRRLSQRDAALASALLIMITTQIAAGGIWTHTLIRLVLWSMVLVVAVAVVRVTSGSSRLRAEAPQ